MSRWNRIIRVWRTNADRGVDIAAAACTIFAFAVVLWVLLFGKG